MNLLLLPSFKVLTIALIAGFLFGFLLRKGGVSRSDTILNQLILKDFTVMKIILSAIVTTSLGSFVLGLFDIAPSLNLSAMPIRMTAIGGAIFGVGMAVVGYCPGTMIAAIAEGSKAAISGFMGMIFGVLIFSILYPYFMESMSLKDSVHLKTLDQYLGVSKILIIFALGFVLFLVGYFFREKDLKS